MAAIMKIWRQINNPTPSIDSHLLEEHSCQISPPSDLKRPSLRLFKEVAPTTTRTTTTRTALATHVVEHLAKNNF